MGYPKPLIENQVKHLLIIISFILLFSSIFISCSKSSDVSKSSDNTTSTDNTTTTSWTQQLGTTFGDYGFSVTSDSSNNVYVTGYTGGGLDGNTNSGSWDIFLVKFNSSGTKQWTKQLGTPLTEMGQGVTTDSSGNIYVSGHTWGGLDGTGHTWGEGDYEGKINLGYTDVFLVKYNSSGTKQWTKQLGTSETVKSGAVVSVVVVVLSVVLLSSLLFLAHEMTVRLKRNMEKMMSICLTWYLFVGLGEPNIYHD